jgi:hypothetical protein
MGKDAVLFLALGLWAALPVAGSSRYQEFSDFTTPLPLPEDGTLVVGIVGGWERWDAPQRIVRRIALRLRARGMPNVWIETVENHRIELAHQLIEKAFDRDRDGRIGPAERDRARLILYGQSLGGSASVRLARDLHVRHALPVRLLVVIDGIGHGAGVVPPNVRAAANLYQRESWPVNGQPEIRAEDPSRTRILGNHRFSYDGKHIDTSEDAWIRRVFMRGHIKMEFDPEVWARVESYVVEAIAQPE